MNWQRCINGSWASRCAKIKTILHVSSSVLAYSQWLNDTQIMFGRVSMRMCKQHFCTSMLFFLGHFQFTFFSPHNQSHDEWVNHITIPIISTASYHVQFCCESKIISKWPENDDGIYSDHCLAKNNGFYLISIAKQFWENCRRFNLIR